MIYFREGLKEKFDKIKDNNFYVLSDYDQTLTSGVSSWELPAHIKNAPEGLKEDCKAIGIKFLEWLKEYGKTGDPELRKKITGWWDEEMSLFVKYKVKLDDIEDAILNDGLVCLRKDTKGFLESLNKRNVPVVVLSAGFVDVIEATLMRENCNFNNIEVFANKLRVDDDNHLLGVKGEMIHWLNKSESNLDEHILEKIKDRQNVILLGDQKSDIDMLPEEKREGAIKIGFKSERVIIPTEKYLDNFDIACDSDTSFAELSNELQLRFGFKLF